MRIRDFLMLVQDQLEPLLPPELRSFQSRVRFWLLQVYYWRPAIHYEVWPQRKNGRLELGLHFEAEREESYRWAAALAERMPELQARLSATDGPVSGGQTAPGPNFELEEWTPTWTRLHQSLPLEALDEPLADEVARRLAHLIETLQPILEECRPQIEEAVANLPPGSSSKARPRYGRFRRRRGLGRRPPL
jgi:hypothetical protein